MIIINWAKLKKFLSQIKHKPIGPFLFVYFTFSSLFLTQFPFVHSDEFWLSGLSRNIMATRDIGVTETFFDLFPRHPHAIKTLFHLLQVFFIQLFDYRIFTFRLISLIFGILSLWYFYKLCLLITNYKKPVHEEIGIALAATLLLSIDIQFIYASHFARQEIILLFALLFSLYFFFSHLQVHKLKHDLLQGIIIGLTVGIHPNSFILALVLILIYLSQILLFKKLNFRNLAFFMLPLSTFGLFFIGLSLWCDPNFFVHYATYGDQFGVLDPLNSKFQELKLFYLKLFYQISGTYYTPNIRFHFFLFLSIIILTITKLIYPKYLSQNKGPFQGQFSDQNIDPHQYRHQKNQIISIMIAIIAVNLGIILIGRYNQTSVVLQFPLFYLLAAFLFRDINKGVRKLAVVIMITILLVNSCQNISPYLGHDYQDYLNEIAKAVPKNAPVLANLNTEPYFNNGQLFDYRNLAFLKEHQISFKDYIRKNKIQYIIYPEEMELIYRERPKWNGLYGNLTYYEDMISFFHTNCRQVYQFTDQMYGIRISPYINAKPWEIKIYQVLTWD